MKTMMIFEVVIGGKRP